MSPNLRTLKNVNYFPSSPGSSRRAARPCPSCRRPWQHKSRGESGYCENRRPSHLSGGPPIHRGSVSGDIQRWRWLRQIQHWRQHANWHVRPGRSLWRYRIFELDYNGDIIFKYMVLYWWIKYLIRLSLFYCRQSNVKAEYLTINYRGSSSSYWNNKRLRIILQQKLWTKRLCKILPHSLATVRLTAFSTY